MASPEQVRQVDAYNFSVDIFLGKTILASQIIDECRLNEEGITTFFYCHNDEPMSNSAISIFRGLIKQILEQQPQLMPLYSSVRVSSNDLVLQSVHQANRILEKACLILPQANIILDGLDECPPSERKEVLETLCKILRDCEALEPGRLRLLVVSQDYADIRKAIMDTELAPRIVHLSQKDNKKSICTYIRSWVQRLVTKFGLSQDVSEYLQNLTVSNAKGNFPNMISRLCNR